MIKKFIFELFNDDLTDIEPDEIYDYDEVNREYKYSTSINGILFSSLIEVEFMDDRVDTTFSFSANGKYEVLINNASISLKTLKWIRNCIMSSLKKFMNEFPDYGKANRQITVSFYPVKTEEEKQINATYMDGSKTRRGGFYINVLQNFFGKATFIDLPTGSVRMTFPNYSSIEDFYNKVKNKQI